MLADAKVSFNDVRFSLQFQKLQHKSKILIYLVEKIRRKLARKVELYKLPSFVKYFHQHTIYFIKNLVGYWKFGIVSSELHPHIENIIGTLNSTESFNHVALLRNLQSLYCDIRGFQLWKVCFCDTKRMMQQPHRTLCVACDMDWVVVQFPASHAISSGTLISFSSVLC